MVLPVVLSDWLIQMLQIRYLREMAHPAGLRAVRTGCVRLTGPDTSHTNNRPLTCLNLVSVSYVTQM